jgi:hypothetical protein
MNTPNQEKSLYCFIILKIYHPCKTLGWGRVQGFLPTLEPQCLASIVIGYLLFTT